MAVDRIPKLKPSNNVDMMNAIRDAASPAYQSRIPAVDQASIEDSVRNLMNHRETRNEFMSVLVNRIGMVTVQQNSWTNPLGIFKKGYLAEGDTVEELAVDIVKPYVYEHDREKMEQMLFGTHRVGSQASFHKVNRADMYAVTTNEMQLSRAFLDSQGGLYKFQGQILSSVMTSDQYDEYLLMSSLFRLYNDQGGFFNVKTPDLTTLASSETEAKQALKVLRTYAYKLQFLSRLYNPAGLAVHAPIEKLVVIVTPEFRAAVDVDAMMGAFNPDRGEPLGRIVEVQAEDVDIDGFQAVVTTEDFFQVYDKVLTSAQQWNPATLSNNHFLHHHQVMSMSRFVPAILFSTGETTPAVPIEYVSTEVSDVTITDHDSETVTADLQRGETYNLAAAVTTLPEGGTKGVSYGLIGNTDPQTFIRAEGVLHVGPEEEGPLTLTAFAADDRTISSEIPLEVTVDAESGVEFWPRERE